LLLVLLYTATLLKIEHNIIPRHVGADSIQGWCLGLVGAQYEASMLEADYVPWLRIPFLRKHCCACWRSEMNPIRPVLQVKLLVSFFLEGWMGGEDEEGGSRD